MFTCISCRVAFETAAEQRTHFATDWHRYNMKRRVANLPPVAAESFNEKVIERREQNAVKTDPRSLNCLACSKNFSSENAYRSHVQSKKHRDREQAQASSSTPIDTEITRPTGDEIAQDDSSAVNVEGEIDLLEGKSTGSPASRVEEVSDLESHSEEEHEGDDVAANIARSRRRIQANECLFCPRPSKDIDDNVAHMSKMHSFFIPDRDILVDLPGLLSYLGEKVATGNLCLFCPNGGREFGSMEAVRKHMLDKSHCKLAYTTDEDRAELADFYAFEGDSEVDEDDEWEDLDASEGEMETPRETGNLRSTTQRLPKLASDGLGLVLPSGRTIGHRSLRVYYAQHLRPSDSGQGSDTTALKLAQVRQRLADPTLALVPIAGGHGAFGRGLEVMKARNAGEAKWARKQANSFKDQKKLDHLRTRVGFVHNNQKYFRDPLLQ